MSLSGHRKNQMRRKVTHLTSSAMVVLMSLRPSRSSAISFLRPDTLFITSSRVFLSSTCCSGDKPLTAAERAAESTEHTHTHQCHTHVKQIVCDVFWFIPISFCNAELVLCSSRRRRFLLLTASLMINNAIRPVLIVTPTPRPITAFLPSQLIVDRP